LLGVELVHQTGPWLGLGEASNLSLFYSLGLWERDWRGLQFLHRGQHSLGSAWLARGGFWSRSGDGLPFLGCGQQLGKLGEV